MSKNYEKVLQINGTGHQQCTMASLHDSIKLYFRLGFRRGEIPNLFSTTDDIDISMHTLSRTLKCTGLYCRKNESDSIEVAPFLIDQLEGHGLLNGFSSSHGAQWDTVQLEKHEKTV